MTTVWVVCFNLFEEPEPFVVGVFKTSHKAYCKLTKYLCKYILDLSDRKKEKLLSKMKSLETEKEQNELLQLYSENDTTWSFCVQKSKF